MGTESGNGSSTRASWNDEKLTLVPPPWRGRKLLIESSYHDRRGPGFEFQQVHLQLGPLREITSVTRSDRTKEQLGMSLGAACNRLRRQVMHMLAVECGRGVCHVCGEPIATWREFTIEHKMPWENRDPDSFWDLENIAFSHTRCNRNQTNGAGPPRRHPTRPGYAWCRHHETEHPIGEFSMRTANGKRKPRIDCKRGRVERKQLGLPS